jgi:hypothetical protein
VRIPRVNDGHRKSARARAVRRADFLAPPRSKIVHRIKCIDITRLGLERGSCLYHILEEACIVHMVTRLRRNAEQMRYKEGGVVGGQRKVHNH